MSLPVLFSEGFCVELLKLGLPANKYFPLGHLSFPLFLSSILRLYIIKNSLFSLTRYASQFTLSLVEGILEIRNKSAKTFYLQNLRKASNIQHTQYAIRYTQYEPKPQFPPAPRLNSCATTSRGQSKESCALKGDYRGQSSDFNMKKGSQKKLLFGLFLLTIVWNNIKIPACQPVPQGPAG